MSQSTAVRTTRALPRPVPAPAPVRLRVVTVPGHTRPRAGLAVVCLALLVAGLVGLLLLNVSLERGAYVLRDQQVRSDQLRERQQALREELQQLQAPQSLARRAEALGMVPSSNVAFKRLSDGRVLGVPGRAAAAPSPTVARTPARRAAGPEKATGRAATPGRPAATVRGTNRPAATPRPAARTAAAQPAGTPRTGARATVPARGAPTP